MTLRTMLIATAFAAMALPAVAADAKLAAAIAASSRAPENSARDGARHPAASLAFWGLKPGQTVVEISPGGGYWSEILAPYAKATGGHYIVAMGKPDQKLPAKFADKAVYGDIHYTVFSKDSGPLAAPGSADIVITARNIHNWIWTSGMADKAMRDFYAVLKPGGVLAIEEHRADPRPETDNAKSGYVSSMSSTWPPRPASSWTPSPRSMPIPRIPRIILSASGPCRPRARAARGRTSPARPVLTAPNMTPSAKATA